MSDGIPSPSPDFPQPIKNVTGNANVKIQNKNLANINEIPSQSGYVAVQIINDTIKIYDNNNPVGYTPLNIKLKQLCPSLKVGDIVILSFKTTSNMSNKNAIYLEGANILWNKETTKTITQSMLDSTVALYGGYNETAVISEFQIELGSTATTYVAHQEQNLPFTFEEGQFLADDEELKNNGIYKKWKKVTFSGTTATLSDAKTNGAYYCNKKVAGNLVGQTLTFDEEVTDAIIEYELAEPETIAYNSTQASQYEAIKNARSYTEVTHITSTSDEEGFDMKVTAIGDINAKISAIEEDYSENLALSQQILGSI